MSGNWGAGYVTDIDYLPGWYPQQSPMHLAVACLLLGIACDLPAGDDEVHYMELGCGLGFGARRLLLMAGVLGGILIPVGAPMAMGVVALSMLARLTPFQALSASA